MTLKTNMDESNLILKFRLRKMDKTRNYVIKHKTKWFNEQED